MQNFDVIIIGSGSGNSIIDEKFDNLNVALVEAGTFGGTCLNAGCIPTKMYVYAADIVEYIKKSDTYGIPSKLGSIEWKVIRERIFSRIDNISKSGLNYRENLCKNITVFSEEAIFIDKKIIRFESGKVISAPTIVIAGGSAPNIPNIEGLRKNNSKELVSNIYTSDNIMRLEDFPKKLLIIGGGYIAAEFAHIFNSLGSEVTQIVRSELLLQHHDSDISTRFTDTVSEKWKLVLGENIGKIISHDKEVSIITDKNQYLADAVLIAAGRKSNASRLNLGQVGYDISSEGSLVVDKYQRVLSGGDPVSNIWSLGDISSLYKLKHVANHEAKIVAHNMFNASSLRAANHKFVPSAVFSSPQVASVGMTEKEAHISGIRCVSYIQEYSDVAYGWAMEDNVGFVKIIVEIGSSKILGAHIMGADAAILIQIIVQAMAFECSAKDISAGQYWIHPALTEVVENALLGAVRAAKS